MATSNIKTSPKQHEANLQLLRDYPIGRTVCGCFGTGIYRYGTVEGYERSSALIQLRVRWIMEPVAFGDHSHEEVTRIAPSAFLAGNFFAV